MTFLVRGGDGPRRDNGGSSCSVNTGLQDLTAETDLFCTWAALSLILVSVRSDKQLCSILVMRALCRSDYSLIFSLVCKGTYSQKEKKGGLHMEYISREKTFLRG